MKDETKVALQQSIEHWERLRDGTHHEHEQPSDLDCALCNRFTCGVCQRFNNYGELIEKCPVFEVTGIFACRNSPYGDAKLAFHNSYDEFTSEERYNRMNAEVQFLKSLLPKE